MTTKNVQDQNDRVSSNDINSFMNLFDNPSLGLLIANENGSSSSNQKLEILDVNELEKAHVIEADTLEKEREEKEEEFLKFLELFLEKKSQSIIESGKLKIDQMEEYIQNKIVEKLACKVIQMSQERQKSELKDMIKNAWCSQLKYSLMIQMQQNMKQYMEQVAKVYDLGLNHFRDYIKESEQQSSLNHDKLTTLNLDIQQISNGDVVSQLNQQSFDELEEVKQSKELNDSFAKQISILNLLKEKMTQIEQSIDSMNSKSNQQQQPNHQQQQQQHAKLQQQQQQQLYQQQQQMQQQPPFNAPYYNFLGNQAFSSAKQEQQQKYNPLLGKGQKLDQGYEDVEGQDEEELLEDGENEYNSAEKDQIMKLLEMSEEEQQQKQDMLLQTQTQQGNQIVMFLEGILEGKEFQKNFNQNYSSIKDSLQKATLQKDEEEEDFSLQFNEREQESDKNINQYKEGVLDEEHKFKDKLDEEDEEQEGEEEEEED